MRQEEKKTAEYKGMAEKEIQFVKTCVQENDMHRFYTWNKWTKLRDKVLEMDRHECVDCKKRGIYSRASTVHHNQFVRSHPECALEIWYVFHGKRYRNLVSLCHNCHEERHGRKFEGRPAPPPLTEERW